MGLQECLLVGWRGDAPVRGRGMFHPERVRRIRGSKSGASLLEKLLLVKVSASSILSFRAPCLIIQQRERYRLFTIGMLRWILLHLGALPNRSAMYLTAFPLCSMGLLYNFVSSFLPSRRWLGIRILNLSDWTHSLSLT